MHNVDEEAVNEVDSLEGREVLDMFSIESEPPCFNKEKFDFRSIQDEVDELTHLLAFYYNTWWRRMEPLEEPVVDHMVTADEPLRAELFTCYYCGRDYDSRAGLKAHVRKRHRQLYKCLPVVLLERIKLERDKTYMKIITSNYSSLEGSGDVKARRQVYHCADCAHSSTSRQKIKVHIFTRHIFKKLYIKYSLKHFGVSRYFIGVKQNMSKNDERPCHPPFHYHALCWRWLERAEEETMRKNGDRKDGLLFSCGCCSFRTFSREHLDSHMRLMRRRLCLSLPFVRLERYVKDEGYGTTWYSGCDLRVKEEPDGDEIREDWNAGNLSCSYCELCFSSTTDLGGHIATIHGSILKYLPIVRLERVLIESNQRELLPDNRYSNLNLPEVKSVRPSLEDMKADLGYYTQPSNCGSSVDESSSTYSRLCSTPVQGVGARRRFYRCSECVYSARSRGEIKVHIFTRHIYRILYSALRDKSSAESSSRVTARAALSFRLPFVKLMRLSTAEIEARLSAVSALPSCGSLEEVDMK